MVLPFSHEKNRPLCEWTTFGIGGPARFFVEAKTVEEMEEMVNLSQLKNIPFFILGKGSNTLFDDRGFDGLVILNRIDHMRQNENRFTVGGGFSFSRLGLMTSKMGLSGLEFSPGIPGSIGGAIYMNAGANNQETKDSLVQVTYLTEKGEKMTLQRPNIEFSYRLSSFQKMKGVIVEAVFELKPDPEAKKRQEDIISYRLKTQPYRERSAGCVFRNPPNETAGKLIEQCGLKGAHSGGAFVSEMHANFIVNRENATAKDVLHLIEEVKEKVHAMTGILLEEEIRLVPFEFSR